MADDDAYGGVFGAIPYAFRRGESRVFRSYVVVGSLLSALIGLLFSFALIGVFASTTGGRGGTFTFSRSFFVFVGLFLVGPLLAPILSVARDRRRGEGSARSELVHGGVGYVFLVSLVVALFASVPPALQERPSSLIASDLVVFYWLPQVSAIAVLAVSTLLVLVVVWKL